MENEQMKGQIGLATDSLKSEEESKTAKLCKSTPFL